MLPYLIISALVLIVDQLVKAWASISLKAAGSITVIKGVLHFTYAENTGAAFSILDGQRWFFMVVGVLAIAGLIVMSARGMLSTRLSRVAAALLAGGIVGNLIDRVTRGFVVDMFELRFVRFAIFNVADMALTAGVALMMLYIFTLKEVPGENQGAGSGS